MYVGEALTFGDLLIRAARDRGDHVALVLVDERYTYAEVLERSLARYVGRTKDMLKVGGENVAPVEIESHLSTHPEVHMVAVVGRPDERYVEVPVAFVERSPGSRVTDEELIAYCSGELASFKVPREVRFVTEWPLSATKIQKFRLREMLTR